MAPIGSIKRKAEANFFEQECSQSRQIETVNAKFFIYNLASASQAGRRGFDPRLPLFNINSLEAILHGITAKLRNVSVSLEPPREVVPPLCQSVS